MRDQGYQRPAEANAVVHGKRSGPGEWFTEPPKKALGGSEGLCAMRHDK